MSSGRKRRQDKLYKQWVKHVGLPPEAVPRKEALADLRTRGEGKGRFRLFKEKVLDMIKKFLKI